MGVTDDPVLLKLVIQGQSPQEIEQLAQQTQGQLNAKSKVLLDQLTALHKGALDAQNANVLNEIQQEIKARQTMLATVTKIADAQAAAEKKLADDNIKELQRNFDYAMNLANLVEKADAEEMARKKALAKELQEAAQKNTELQLQAFEAITIGAEAVFGIIEGGIHKFEQLGEQIVKNAEIYGSLKGSIDKLREATNGEIADVDLITLKNRAFEKDLKLTDDQFASVAKQAKNFAASLGIDTKEAMNQLIDGLATGRTKMLAHAGVVVDTEAAYRKFAEAQGTVVENMTAEEKLLATQTEALEKIKKKTEEVGETGVTVAELIKKAFAKTTNAITGTLAAIGNAKFGEPTDYASGDLDQIRQDSISRGDPGLYQRALAVRKKADEDRDKARREKDLSPYSDEDVQKQQDQFYGGGGGLYDRQASTDTGAGLQEAYKKRQEAMKRAEEDAKKALEALDKQVKFEEEWDALLRKAGGFEKGDVPTGTLGGVAAEGAPIGLTGSYARTQTLQKAQAERQANIDRSMEAPNETNDLSRGVSSKGALDRMEKSMKEAQDRLDDLRKRSGDGILSAALFGTGGPGAMKDKLRTFAQDAADALGMVSDAGKKMGDALGASLAAFVSGDKSKRASIRQTTHDILEALATQAYSRAIFETAEGLASLALGPIGGVSAGLHFAAAGMFTAVGTTAALGARAVGTSSSAGAGSSSGASGGTSSASSGAGGFGSNGVRSTSAPSDQPVVFNINTMFGDKVSIGRAVNDALHEYAAQTGQGVPAAQVAA